MRGMLAIFLFIAMTALSWGVYGPLLHNGQADMGSSLRQFICVGVAYFLIAVLVPGAYLYLKGENGAWTVGGSLWSLIAGAAGALGALGIIMALSSKGDPLYVMPLVFGGAPVVNTFTTMYLNRSYRDVGPVFLAGLILVVAGAVTVLLFRPLPHKAAHGDFTAGDLAIVSLWVATTALCWGLYGPTLHKGQMRMAGSRLRPLICVGIAYFLIAVIIPVAKMSASLEGGQWAFKGVAWSLAAGAAGAVGAIGVIMAFNFGGRPIYVMPLVFGFAPVINTFVSILGGPGSSEPASPFFYAGLIIVAVGAVVVLVFAPKPKSLAHGPVAPSRPAKV